MFSTSFQFLLAERLLVSRVVRFQPNQQPPANTRQPTNGSGVIAHCAKHHANNTFHADCTLHTKHGKKTKQKNMWHNIQLTMKYNTYKTNQNLNLNLNKLNKI
jgi:hypothetical protein